MSKIGVALCGSNGHQIQNLFPAHEQAELVGVFGIPNERLPETVRGVAQYTSFEELLKDPTVHLVSLCSARRSEQARLAIRCLDVGKHVYAEKPCAMTESDLDAILSAARRTKRVFHEMAGTCFEQPWFTLREVVRSGTIGTVVQVLAQKSYPLHDERPQDEDIDGGLTLQNGVHALRFVEHISGQHISHIHCLETQLGNPKSGDLRIASSMIMRLEHGGLATATANYLNPRAFPFWGNECVRVFGTNGMLEAVDGGSRTRLVLQDRDCGALDTTKKLPSFFDQILNQIQNDVPMPISLDDELHPTRMVIRARASAKRF